MEQLALTGVIAGVFYAAPVASDPQLPARGALSVALMVALAVLVVRQVRRYPDRIGRLVNVFLVVVALLALACYAMAVRQPDQFTGLATRTDALYFTITTISTVGYGDIHAVGQSARALVTMMIVFNIIFLGALGSAISMSYQRWREVAAPRSGSTAVKRDSCRDDRDDRDDPAEGGPGGVAEGSA
ncbi:MAG: potassium channel family protein [Actinomyces bowdenii]|nr:potassium channel family protein [Actinomyces bowdenii]